MSLPLKESSLVHISRLEQQQSRDPANAVLAHDLGLAHYWQAKKRGNSGGATVHWQRVVANWAMVLESAEYWRDWCAERSSVYGKPISEGQVASVKEQLSDRLTEELAHVAQVDSTGASLHLNVAFHLEVKAIRLLKQGKGLLLPSQSDPRLYCGPLLAQQLAILPQVEDFFQRWSASDQDDQVSLHMILAPIQQDKDQPVADNRIARRQLRLCFSQLGTALIYLEREMPQRALNVLGDLRCFTCEPETDLQTQQPAVVSRLPVRCRDDCMDFARLNPAYASTPDGRPLFYHHAVELSAGAHLSLAYQSLNVKPVDTKVLLGHLQETLDLGQVIGLQEALRAGIVNAMLGWADVLGRDKRWDEAFALLESTERFDTEERWKGKLASLLNARGVQGANEKRWTEAVVDLRRACELNPHSQLFHQNLENAVQGYANAAYEAGDDTLALDLLDEAIRLGEIKPVQPQVPPSATPPPAEEAEPTPASTFILTPAERANPALFDEQGKLELDVFDDSGRGILARAHEEAAAIGAEFLRIPALVSALAQFEGGETARLLEQQGIPRERLQAQAEAAAPGAASDERLRHVARLSQFDLWFSVLKVLDLAWEIAQYDQGRIGESHILYGLLVSRHAETLLEGAGVDVDQMTEQAGWH
jgi:tetratricopeptide (TPR) repeat protein